MAVQVIDFDEDGFITQADIYQLMLRLGEMLADYALDDMVDAVDMDKDGKISLRGQWLTTSYSSCEAP